jgi:transcriptional regulator of acetoin/glycerol metabolism
MVAKIAAEREFIVGYLTELLTRNHGNLSKSAREAGLDRSNFRRYLRRYSIAVLRPHENPTDQ